MIRRLSVIHWLCVLAFIGGMMLSIPLGQESYGKPLDVRFWYSGEQALAYLASLDPVTASRYLVHEVLDLLFIFSYSGFLWRAWPSERFRVLAFLPGVFDWIETTGILAVLLAPSLSQGWLGSLIATATPIKYVLFYSGLFHVLLEALRQVFSRAKGRP